MKTYRLIVQVTQKGQAKGTEIIERVEPIKARNIYAAIYYFSKLCKPKKGLKFEIIGVSKL